MCILTFNVTTIHVTATLSARFLIYDIVKLDTVIIYPLLVVANDSHYRISVFPWHKMRLYMQAVCVLIVTFRQSASQGIKTYTETPVTER